MTAQQHLSFQPAFPYRGRVLRICIGWAWIIALGLGVQAQHATNAPAFAEASSGARKFQLMPGLKLDVWAAEPQLSNSVAFSFDGRGRVFLAESDRWAISVFDITAHTNWLLQDMSFRNVTDRAVFLTNQFATNLTLLTKDSEAVRMVEDRDGDGRADHSEVIATGFNSVVDGTAAGVLATSEGIYFANIPSLWRLSLPPLASTPENRNLKTENLASGFGVHIGVSGHDFHGLIQGPDGRIYMSFGDRGCVLTSREGLVIQLPDTGGVLRCEPDGRNLEVFCYGLRNPQELAFDDLGNLWTVDNDTAGADPCRVLHLVEGGDYGWRTSYQHMDGFGPWVQEELWRGGQDGILPPAGTVSQGPCGLAFYPGTGFGDRLKGTFLHADFPGGVWAFTVKPQGASSVVDRKEKFLWNCWPTDVDFGPDGGAYILDWVSGWGQTPRGRIYRVTPNELTARYGVSPSSSPSRYRNEVELVAQVKRLLGEGMAQRGEKELLNLLGHPDRRVRLAAQWELAGRGKPAFGGLRQVAFSNASTLARIHALWAIGQIARAIEPGTPESRGGDLSDELFGLIRLLDDADEQVRGQAARMLGDAELINASQPLNAMLDDPSPPTAFQATMAIGSLIRSSRRGHYSTSQKVAALLEEKLPAVGRLVSQKVPQGLTLFTGAESVLGAMTNRPSGDPFLRFARIRQWANQEVAEAGWPSYNGISGNLKQWATHPSAEVRGSVLEALRRRTNRFVTNFLADPDPRLINAAGRAIHDVPIVDGFPALASFITKIDCPTNLYSRVIDACYRLGTQQHAQMLAGFAAREDVPDWARVLAMRALGDWEKPMPLDRVNGLWRPLATLAAERKGDQSPVTSPATRLGNPLLDRAAQAQAGRNLGRAAEVPELPSDLGRSVSYADAVALRRNPAPAQRAFLRVAGDLINPFNLNEAGQPAGTREVLPLQVATVEAAAKLRVKEAGTPLYEKFSDSRTPSELRQSIVVALAVLNSPVAGDAVKAALSNSDPRLRAAAVPFVDRLDGADAATILAALVPGKPDEWRLAQAALAQLGRRAVADTNAAVTLRRFADQAARGGFPEGLRLDVREAYRMVQPTAPSIAGKSPLDAFQVCLQGGDAIRGRDIFVNNPGVQCLRCHKVSNEGGTVGPELTGIGGRQDRPYLLESIVAPNARIAPGFESVVLTLRDGRSLAGTLKRETGEALDVEVVDPDTGEVHLRTLSKSAVVSRERGVSAMPEGLAEQLSPFEVRDLVEYLATLR